nr:MAG TPA: hypothetical protein [Crassvirales sp.]
MLLIRLYSIRMFFFGLVSFIIFLYFRFTSIN